MVNFELDKINWDYNVPRSMEFTFNDYNNCTICANEEIREWSAPYIVALVPHDKIVRLLKGCFDFITTPDLIKNHQKHIRAKFTPREEIAKEAMEQLKTIESDVNQKVNEKMVIESAIRGLFARKLILEMEGTYGREYRDIVNSLNKWVELKLKMQGEVSDDKPYTLANLIKLYVKEPKDADKLPEQRVTTTRILTRDGTKESIEYYVRGRIPSGYIEGDRVTLQDKGQQGEAVRLQANPTS